MLEEKYEEAVPGVIRSMADMFDLSKQVHDLCSFTQENGKIKIDEGMKENWEMRGKEEFGKFYKAVCNLPQVTALMSILWTNFLNCYKLALIYYIEITLHTV